MIKRTLVILTFFSTCFLAIHAQERLVEKANEKYEAYSFTPAIDIYQKVLSKGYASQDLLEKLGNSYYFNADYENASIVFKQLTEEYGDQVDSDFFFRYAQTLRTLDQYEDADAMMQKFISMTSEDGRADRFMTERDYRKEIRENSGRYDIAPFEYNSKYSDFAPAYYKEGLLFSSDRDTGNLARYRHTWNSKDFLDLYKVNVDSSSNNLVVKLNNVNSRLHESTSVATAGGDTLYFTRNNFKDGKYIRDEKGFVRLKIFRATLVDGEWTELEDLKFNSDTYSMAHPSLSADGKILYVASDKPGGFGESDLYEIPINPDGSFGEPKNMGNSINTEARETFPYMTSEGILYFSSDGHPGLGGLDIFGVKVSNHARSRKILNVGKPVNSKMDDFTFIFVEESRKGFFASNRKGGMGSDDIYSFLETRPLIFECAQPVSGTVRDKITNDVLVGASVKVIDENNEEILTVITDENGSYQLTCDCNQGNFVRAQTQGYVPAEEYLGVSDGKPRIMDFYLEPERITVGFGDDLTKLLQLSTIYFDFDKFDIRPDAEVEIQKIIAAMEKYPSLKIKANSHTDSRGDDAYNLWLSKKRAESTVNYMISKGISADRLQQEGYGESQLVNECGNGVNCSKVKHELNRRSEFIIIE